MAWKTKENVVYDRVKVNGQWKIKYFGTFPFAHLADQKIAELNLRRIRNRHRLADYSATLWTYCDTYETLPDAKRNKGTRYVVHFALNLVKKYFFASTRVIDVGVQDARNFLAWLRAEQRDENGTVWKRAYNHATAHIQMRNFSSVMNLAVKDKVIENNPVLEPLTKMGEPAGRRITLTIEQEDRLFDAAMRIKTKGSGNARNVELYRMIKTLFATGVRKAELMNMRKEDLVSPSQIEIRPVEYDDEAGDDPTKSDEPYIVDLNFEIAPWFQEVESGRIWKLWKTKHSFYKAFKRCVELSGLPKKTSPHTGRHTFAKNALQTGTTLAELKDMLHHKELATTLRYSRFERTKLKQNVDAMVRQPKLKVV